MSSSPLNPTIAEFPSDGRIWRVDFLGGLQRNPDNPYEPTIQVIISPLRDALQRDPDELARTSAVIGENRTTIHIGVGQLPYLKVGSLWADGRCLSYGAGKECEFPNLQIRRGNFHLLKANRIVDGAWLIPSSHHEVGMGQEAFCLTVAYNGDPHGIIIPTIELLRFYYAVSTPLARAMFLGDFFQNLNAVIDPRQCAFDPTTACTFLKLRREIHDLEGWFIGRILLSDEAKGCMKSLYDSLARQSSRGQSFVYAPASFPFSGETNLRAHGKYIKTRNATTWRFLVFSLEHCTAPFPLERLIVDRSFSNPAADGLSPESPGLDWLPASTRTVTIRAPANPTLQSKREPNKNLEPIIFPIISDSFSFLQGKKVEKLSKEQMGKTSMLQFTEGGSVFAELFSTGQGSYAQGNSIAPAEVQPRQRRKGLPAGLGSGLINCHF